MVNWSFRAVAERTPALYVLEYMTFFRANHSMTKMIFVFAAVLRKAIQKLVL
jgi:hypothetical protein